MFASNPAYVAYETLLKRLHRLIAEGKGDTDAADVVREAMDIPFRRLSKPERDRLNHLSGDLYQLQDDEVYEPVDDPAERSRERMEQALYAAIEKQDSDTVLSLLRKGADFLTSDQIAQLRSIAYEWLGHLDTALLFMQYVSEKQPQRALYKGTVLKLLYNLGRMEEAVAQAYVCIADASSEPGILIPSASVLYRYVSDGSHSVEDVKPVYTHIIAALQRALKDANPSTFLPPQLISGALLVLGYAYEDLGQDAEARTAYVQALRWDQQNELAIKAITNIDAQEEHAEAEQKNPARQAAPQRELPPSNFAIAGALDPDERETAKRLAAI